MNKISNLVAPYRITHWSRWVMVLVMVNFMCQLGWVLVSHFCSNAKLDVALTVYFLDIINI